MSSILTGITEKLKNWLPLALVIMVGMLLRIFAVPHGFPYILNIDEPALVRTTLGLRESIWINHFDWPHFNYYLHYLFYEIFIKFRGFINIMGWTNVRDAFPFFWDDPFAFYALSRLINIFLYCLSAIPLYLFFKEIFGKRIALFGSLLFLLLPYGISVSLYAFQEPALISFSIWAVYLTSRASRDSKLKNFIYAGILWGLASSVKYNAILLSLLVFTFFFAINRKWDRKSLKDLFVMYMTSAFTFLLVNPSVIKYWNIFWSYTGGKGFLWQMFENSDPLKSWEYLPRLHENLINYFYNLDPVISVIFIFGALMCLIKLTAVIFKRSTWDMPDRLALGMFITFSLIFLYISRYGRAGPHYFTFLDFIPVFLCCYVFYLTSKLIISRKIALLYSYSLMAFILMLLIPNDIERISTFLRPANISEAALFAKSGPKNDIYMKGGELKTFTYINNTGFKKVTDESKIMAGNRVISEEKLEEDKYKLLKAFDVSPNLSRSIYVYEKL